MRRIDQVVVSAAATLLIVGCAGAPVPHAQLAEAKADIRGAEEVGAERHPDASLHLKIAKDQTALAERLIKEDDQEGAARAIERAQVNAELSLVQSRTADQQAAGWTAMQKVNALERESRR